MSEQPSQRASKAHEIDQREPQPGKNMRWKAGGRKRIVSKILDRYKVTRNREEFSDAFVWLCRPIITARRLSDGHMTGAAECSSLARSRN